MSFADKEDMDAEPLKIHLNFKLVGNFYTPVGPITRIWLRTSLAINGKKNHTKLPKEDMEWLMSAAREAGYIVNIEN